MKKTEVLPPDAAPGAVRPPDSPPLGETQVAPSSDGGPPPASIDDFLPGGPTLGGKVLAGKYQVGRLLGVGGMGAVYTGENLTLDVPVAIKIMHPSNEKNSDDVRRFRREARAASLLTHRNVVRVLDFGEHDGRFFIVMELLKGKTLSGWLDRGIPSLADVQDILCQVLDAFEAAHSLGIVHRDLKPENVFLMDEPGGKRVVKVVDFGLAHVEDKRDTEPTLTQEEMVAGTPHFMSPEQCRSLAVGPSTDIYAIGCLLTVMLQRKPLFDGRSTMDIIMKQMFAPPPPLSRPAGAEPIPPLLERLRLDLLAKAPENRPADIAELRRRFLEAMSPDATSQRLPPRKSEMPRSGRLDRDAWESESELPTARLPPPILESAKVGLVRLSAAEEGVNQECLTGLAMHGVEVLELDADERGALPPAMILDADQDLDAACAWLSRRSEAAALSPAIVCVAELTTEGMRRLIAAGAADVIAYPVQPDVLWKKASRAIRRKR
jgi:eukaryotic-like serine/threonine-protein kinase